MGARRRFFWSAEGTYVDTERSIKRSAIYCQAICSTTSHRWEILMKFLMRRECAERLPPPVTPPAVTGLDLVTATEGRIAAMYRFLDGAGL